ncbi:MAG: PIN domain-containing protein [Candidatus Omnitrophica bacterium]|nr:PIN domain-containing protein [Candidatus Omnitrophota bacterium]
MNFILDTDTTVYWLKGDKDIEAKIIAVGLVNVRTTILSCCELYYGAYKSRRIEQNIKAIEELKAKIPVLLTSKSAKDLAQGYVTHEIIPEKHMEDALHVAIASLNKIDFFVTWNCTHIASAHKRKKIRLYNAVAGMFCPEIVLPEEIIAE